MFDNQMQANLYVSASCHLLNRNTGGPGLVDSVSEVADARACQCLCEAHAQCAHFVYHLPGHSARWGRVCQLRSPALAGMRGEDMIKVGPKFC